ncbi:hypothetical protein DFH07DRAFT_795476 [Mycena maculata]|uniref:Uncharacterized protein n=1 Tax=Mycena maculata TaxID=230809 RepID=A0AAD7NWZ5_9AGAR|nr:hypothetical protein DFH07DRAFT_795476 [Mycena maculata]
MLSRNAAGGTLLPLYLFPLSSVWPSPGNMRVTVAHSITASAAISFSNVETASGRLSGVKTGRLMRIRRGSRLARAGTTQLPLWYRMIMSSSKGRIFYTSKSADRGGLLGPSPFHGRAYSIRLHRLLDNSNSNVGELTSSEDSILNVMVSPAHQIRTMKHIQFSVAARSEDQPFYCITSQSLCLHQTGHDPPPFPLLDFYNCHRHMLLDTPVLLRCAGKLGHLRHGSRSRRRVQRHDRQILDCRQLPDRGGVKALDGLEERCGGHAPPVEFDRDIGGDVVLERRERERHVIRREEHPLEEEVDEFAQGLIWRGLVGLHCHWENCSKMYCGMVLRSSGARILFEIAAFGRCFAGGCLHKPLNNCR